MYDIYYLMSNHNYLDRFIKKVNNCTNYNCLQIIFTITIIIIIFIVINAIIIIIFIIIIYSITIIIIVLVILNTIIVIIIILCIIYSIRICILIFFLQRTGIMHQSEEQCHQQECNLHPETKYGSCLTAKY